MTNYEKLRLEMIRDEMPDIEDLAMEICKRQHGCSQCIIRKKCEEKGEDWEVLNAWMKEDADEC